MKHLLSITRFDPFKYLRRILFYLGALVSASVLLIGVLWGVPVPKADRVMGVDQLVTGRYLPKARILVPTRAITNISEVSNHMQRLYHA